MEKFFIWRWGKEHWTSAEDAIPSTSWLFGTSLGSCHPHLHRGTAVLCCSNLMWQGSFCWKLGKGQAFHFTLAMEKYSQCCFHYYLRLSSWIMQVEKQGVQIIPSSSEFVHLYLRIIWNAKGTHWDVSAQGNETLNQKCNPWSLQKCNPWSLQLRGTGQGHLANW